MLHTFAVLYANGDYLPHTGQHRSLSRCSDVAILTSMPKPRGVDQCTNVVTADKASPMEAGADDGIQQAAMKLVTQKKHDIIVYAVFPRLTSFTLSGSFLGAIPVHAPSASPCIHC